MDYETARKHMVDSQVRTNDVTDLRIQQAFEAVPREIFLPTRLREQAYVEKEIVYAEARALLTARDFAKLLAALQPKAADLVLDVGVGTGYSASILANLCEMVVATEPDAKLSAAAQAIWSDLGVANAAVIEADLAAGAPKQGPFDLIVIAAVVETVPQALLDQLKDGGRLGAFLADRGVVRGVVWRRAGDVVSAKAHFDAAARHRLPGFQKPKVFAF